MTCYEQIWFDPETIAALIFWIIYLPKMLVQSFIIVFADCFVIDQKYYVFETLRNSEISKYIKVRMVALAGDCSHALRNFPLKNSEKTAVAIFSLCIILRKS